MPISAARKIAFELLRRVEAEGAYASDLLHSELGANVKPVDAALATELTLGVLRWRRLLDFLIERQLRKPLARLDLPVELALRMGLYQLRFLARVPARAAVNESVELVKGAKKSSAAPLVNAVLRHLADETRRPTEELLPASVSPAERLAILHSHPTWMVERWLSRWGEARTISLLETNNRAPRLSCALHEAARQQEIFNALEKAGLHVEPGRLLRLAFAVTGGSPVRTESFRKGWLSIQDEASQAIPLLLDVHPGDHVLDLCAAPGGKTAPLVRAAGEKGDVIAADRHAHRLRAMRDQFVRLGLRNVKLVELDATQPLPFGGKFQRIQVDAPCSGTGTLARHPEIRWRLEPRQLAGLHQLQVAMLASAAGQLATGGRLVYSTCSLELEENEAVVAEVLAGNRSLRLVPSSETVRALAPHLVEGVEPTKLFDRDGQFHTAPGENLTDGFFAGILTRDS
jgi:16S rRNA (cytosine967-C5)-methyltransferase